MKDNNYKIEIANRLKLFMNRLNLNQIQLSKELNVRNTRINNYLNAVSLPDLEFLEIMCRKYKSLDLRWFLTGDGELNSLSIAEPDSGYNTVSKIEDVAPSPLEAAQIEIGYLKQQVADKDTIIALLMKNK